MGFSASDFPTLTGKQPPRRRVLSAANRGRSLETAILASQRADLILLTKMPTSSKRIGGGKIIQLPSPVDFFGIHVPTGRMICFDAKQHANPNGLPAGMLAAHQWNELIRYGQTQGGPGAISGLLCESTALGRYYWCPWPILLWPGFVRKTFLWHEMLDLGDTQHLPKWERLFGGAK